MIGCGEGEPWRDPALEGVAPSAELEADLRDGYQSLADPDGGDPVVLRDLERFEELRQGIYDRRHRAEAVDSLFAEWERRPSHVLWPELAVRDRRFVGARDRRQERFAHPECADTSTAFGVYMAGWMGANGRAYSRFFPAAWARLDRVDDFSSVWIGLKAAYGERLAGRPAHAIAIARQVRTIARKVGGKRLEALVWEEIARDAQAAGALDDALHAVVLAEALYVAGMPAGGAVPGLFRIREVRANVHGSRRENEAAFDTYDGTIRSATERDQVYLALRNMTRAGSLAETVGDRDLGFAYLRRGVSVAAADDDSLSVPRLMMNIARRFRLGGDLDSCLVYQNRARSWVDAFSDKTNVGRMALMSAEYYTQVGEFGVVDSLLTIAASSSRNQDTAEARAELHLELIEGWMEIGRADLIERSITAIEDLRGGFGDTYNDRHTVADLNLAIGEFHTRRGEYAEAVAAFDLAEEAIAGRADVRRTWKLARNRGLLARERGDLARAEAEFHTCIEIGAQFATPEQESTGRFLLGSVLLARGGFAEAREAFPSTDEAEFVGRFATRVSALLFKGKSFSLEGRYDEALEVLGEARDACSAWSPPDLVARIDLETAIARAGAGDVEGAAAELEDVAVRLAEPESGGGSPDLAYFNGDLRRDLVEALMTLPGMAPATSLRLARAVLPGWSSATGGGDGALTSPQVVYFVGETTSGCWLVSAGDVAWRSLPGAAELRDLIAPVYADMALPGRDPVEADVRRLADVLLGDLASHWSQGEVLTVVPDSDLFGVPWAALPLSGGDGAMADFGALAIFDRPAATGEVGGRHHIGGRVLVIASDDDAAARDEGLADLGDAEREARDVASAWPAGSAILSLGGDAAAPLTRGTDLAGFEAVHVAGHAKVYDGGTDRATLLLSGADGAALTIRDIEGLDLGAELVFLSCCEAAGGRDRGAGYAGLARGFLDAGAKAVVAPVNAVEDAAARAFAMHFYAHWLDGVSVAEALRAAQDDMRRGDPRWRHPSHWAFYQVIRG